MNESGPGEIFDFLSDFLPETLNSLSSRFVFFIAPVEKERFIDSFFRLLDFSSKSVEMS
jgi:hypothetical protein